MGTATAVGVDDDLAARESCVAMGTSDDELARGVHKDLHVLVEQLAELGRQLTFHTGQQDVEDVGLDLVDHTHVGLALGLLAIVSRLHELVMLGADDDGVYS